MWIVLDIGNTRTKTGLFDGASCIDTSYFATPVDLGGWEAALRSTVGDRSVLCAGLTSVVPERTPLALQAIEVLYGISALEVTHKLRLPFALAYTTPETLGTDRLAAAVAAWNRYGKAGDATRPVIVVDAGTAITYEVVTGEGVYVGGVIAAGPGLVRDALTRGTAQLPVVELALTPSTLGTSTREALQSGIMHAFVDSVTGMLERITEDLKADGDSAPMIVATGGWGAWLGEHVQRIEHVDPHLVLHGIRDLLVLNETSRR